MLASNVDGRPADPIQVLALVRFAPTSTQRLIAENQLLVGHNAGNRYEEPFALANKGVGLAAVAFLPLALLAALKGTNELGLERFLGGDHAAHRSTLGYTSHKPVTLVVSAEELVLGVGQAMAFSGLANHQKEMPVLRLNLENLDIGVIACLNVEELSTTVLTNKYHSDLDIDTGSGDDTLGVYNSEVARDLEIKTDSGDDLVIVSFTEVGDDLDINTGHHDDEVDVYSSKVGDNLHIKTEGGSDDVAVQHSESEDLRIWTGGNNDVAYLWNTDVADDLFASMGSGDDRLTVNQSTAGDPEFQGGSGYDKLYGTGNNFNPYQHDSGF